MAVDKIVQPIFEIEIVFGMASILSW